MSERIILAIDTATSCCSVALTVGGRFEGKVLGSLDLDTRLTHSQRLLASIEYLMKATELSWSDIAGVAVSLGPGSFTGLRIGMVTGKGLVMAADIPLLGVSSLDVMAANCVSSKLVYAVQDARKKEVYAAGFRFQNGIPVRETDYQVLSPDRLIQQLSEDVLLVGDGVPAYREQWQKADNIELAPAALNRVSASAMGFLTGDMLARGEMLDVDTAVPLYVRASDAELNLGKKVL